jgi:hypothetical protein
MVRSDGIKNSESQPQSLSRMVRGKQTKKEK